MTTTLRPAGPEEDVPGAPPGTRTRRYEICVNSRPAGGIRITVGPDGPTGRTGELSELAVEENGRRRGRGTVGVLAAEEVLRARGVSRVIAGIPPEPDGTAALAMAASLGYVPDTRWMAKAVPAEADLPELGGGRTARPVTEEEFPAWAARAFASFARLSAASGAGAPDPEAARAAGEEALRVLLPDGAATRDAVLRTLVDADGADVASLWLGFRRSEGSTGRRGWVYAVEADEAHRGQGHGRAAMLLAERECRAAGVDELGLNVHEGNAAALGLYTSLGYRTTRRWYAKRL
ncbi:hypothetical protein BIV57_17665 [Mangrovactinospora gilvigrisea]|uniref:N-acetyltransferase domain-containing protein n=1 Tax=Mangrovactinospora gilvigrisea TaxID=1428644 RepID=A0A1J7C970_9ACTN|nr:GNAT family N-acetyltransferase [Mangrovactinospora gilvigrisea]OIV36186.1 hypothetical protein BIV57_17665 [Mangrovactinospora gilvigrisea]